MAFCSNCGSDIGDSRFCPQCGTRCDSVEQAAPPPMPKTGRLLVSARGSMGVTIAFTVLCAFGAGLLLCIIFMLRRHLAPAARFVFYAAAFAYVYAAIVWLLRRRSHCDVYDDHVVGMSQSGMFSGKRMRRFNLSYDEIANATISGTSVVCIYTKTHDNYQVACYKYAAEVVRRISEQLGSE